MTSTAITYEAWRETAPWYIVSRPDPDEDRHSDAATTYRLMNIAASTAWEAAWRAALASQAAPEPIDEEAPTPEQLMSALAQCRDAFPVPERGAPTEDAWAQAMACPLSVPGYVRAALAAPASQRPVAFAVFAPNGNIRLWSTDHEAVRQFAAEHGLPLTALVPADPSAVT